MCVCVCAYWIWAEVSQAVWTGPVWWEQTHREVILCVHSQGYCKAAWCTGHLLLTTLLILNLFLVIRCSETSYFSFCCCCNCESASISLGSSSWMSFVSIMGLSELDRVISFVALAWKIGNTLGIQKSMVKNLTTLHITEWLKHLKYNSTVFFFS